jgi:hypothetical protein
VDAPVGQQKQAAAGAALGHSAIRHGERRRRRQATEHESLQEARHARDSIPLSRANEIRRD